MKAPAQMELPGLGQQCSFVSDLFAPDELDAPNEAALIGDDHAAALLENAERLAVALCPSLADDVLTEARLAAAIPTVPEWETVQRMYRDPNEEEAETP